MPISKTRFTLALTYIARNLRVQRSISFDTELECDDYQLTLLGKLERCGGEFIDAVLIRERIRSRG